MSDRVEGATTTMHRSADHAPAAFLSAPNARREAIRARRLKILRAVMDDDVGAIGSNWLPVTRQDAERFAAEMGGDGARGEGWQRRHWNPPRH